MRRCTLCLCNYSEALSECPWCKAGINANVMRDDEDSIVHHTVRTAEGRKDDAGKLRYDLIPIKGLEELARVYTVGALKYGDDNWRKGLSHKRIAAAMFRHLQAWRKGEERHDDEMHHLASVIWGCMALIEYETTHPECVERNDA